MLQFGSAVTSREAGHQNRPNITNAAVETEQSPRGKPSDLDDLALTMCPWAKKLKDHKVFTLLAEFPALPTPERVELSDPALLAVYSRALKVVEQVRLMVLRADPELMPFAALDYLTDCLDCILEAVRLFSRTHEGRAIEISNEATDRLLNSLALLQVCVQPPPVTAAQRVDHDQKLAFTITEAAQVLSLSRRTMSRLVRSRRIYPTKTLRLISKEELLRYIREETEASKRTKRFPSLSQRTRPSSGSAPDAITTYERTSAAKNTSSGRFT